MHLYIEVVRNTLISIESDDEWLRPSHRGGILGENVSTIPGYAFIWSAKRVFEKLARFISAQGRSMNLWSVESKTAEKIPSFTFQFTGSGGRFILYYYTRVCRNIMIAYIDGILKNSFQNKIYRGGGGLVPSFFMAQCSLTTIRNLTWVWILFCILRWGNR